MAAVVGGFVGILIGLALVMVCLRVHYGSWWA